ncbi:MAG: hypothetical protein WC951_06875 [Bacteroidales bacterium]
MRRHLFSLIFLISIGTISCKDDTEELLVSLNLTGSLSFSGTFKTINSENLSGAISLSISNGYYECFTTLPFGHGAGKVEKNNATINFIDTLFFPIPAIYGPSYVLSGEYYYDFNGKNLKMWREKNVGSVEYNLAVIDCENSYHGILKNLTGLDGCGWIIQLRDSTMLEPINLDDFDIELIENKSVCIQFQERNDLGSYCMVGKIVELTFIE